MNESYICEECENILSDKEIKRGINLCEECDDECHCSLCEENNKSKQSAV